MANECYFKMQVKGTFGAIQKFYNGLVHNGPIWIGRGIYHTIEQDSNDLMISFKDFRDTNGAIIEGITKHSLVSSLIDWKKSDFTKNSFDENPDIEYLSLFEACEKFNVNIEAYSREELMGFEEHIKYENKYQLIDEVDFRAFYDNANEIIKTEGGYGDWEFKLECPYVDHKAEQEKILNDIKALSNKYYNKKGWDEFIDSGLLWFINTILHAFGWAIVIDKDINNNTIEVYPARVKVRGFSESSNNKGYKKLTNYLHNNIRELMNEVNDIEESEDEK